MAYTKLVGTTDLLDGTNTYGAYTFYIKYTADKSGTCTKLLWYVSWQAAGTSLAAIYSDNAGEPGTVLAQSSEVTDIAGQWNEHTISPISITATTVYWLAIHQTGNSLRYNGVGGTRRYRDESYSSTYTFQNNPSSLTSDAAPMATYGAEELNTVGSFPTHLRT